MAPSPRSSKGSALLRDVERHWRQALSFLASDEPIRAAREVDRAGRCVRELMREVRDCSGDEQAAVARGIQSIRALYKELLRTALEGKRRVGRELARTRQGAHALRAYSSGRKSRRYDATA